LAPNAPNKSRASALDAARLEPSAALLQFRVLHMVSIIKSPSRSLAGYLTVIGQEAKARGTLGEEEGLFWRAQGEVKCSTHESLLDYYVFLMRPGC
jgi:hypothetical protein